MPEKENAAPDQLVAFCGLFCGECCSYQNGKCLGCSKDKKTLRCKIVACNLERRSPGCAQCNDFSDVHDCKKFNTIVSRIFEWIFHRNRKACIARIREIGREEYAREMAGRKLHSV